MNDQITYRVCHTADLNAGQRTELQALLDLVYEGDFAPEDWDHALGGLHTLAELNGQIIAHASVVQRAVLLGDQPRRIGYLEAMGVHPHWQRRGIGRALMAFVNAQIERAYDFGLLSPSEEGLGLYASCGWETWRGELRTFTPDGVLALPDEEVMVYRVNGLPTDLTQPLTCDYRSGDAW